MRYFRLLAVPAVFFSLAAAEAQSGRALAERVATAMGGTRRVLAVKTIMVRGTGENYNLGQNWTPESELPRFEVTQHVRFYDFANARWRLDQTRVPRFPTANANPARQRHGFDLVAYDITSDTSMRRLGERPTIDRRAELLYHPIGFIQAALSRGARVSQDATRGQFRRLMLDSDGERYTMTIDARTMLPVRIERKIPNAMLGDMVLSNEFPEWYETQDMRVPLVVVQRLDGRLKLAELRFNGITVDGEMTDIAIPESVRNAALVVNPVNVTVDSIARGVWFLAGGSHHSVAIEMKDHLLLVEAPQTEERTLAAIRAARSLRPGKPVRAVINTHHHFDHAGGIRAAMSEGVAIITHALNRSFYEGVARRPFTIVPDQLAKNRKPVTVEGVRTRRTLTDETRIVDIYEIEGNPHSGSILMVHLPEEKLLIEADVYTPQAANITTPPNAPFAKNLVENIDRLNLVIDRVVPIHGRVVPMSDLRNAAK